MVYSKLASAIYNDIKSGLAGYTANPTISMEQLEDDIIDERLQIIKEYALKGVLPKKDLALSIKPDLILLDLMLPKVDGFNVCKELRKSLIYNL